MKRLWSDERFWRHRILVINLNGKQTFPLPTEWGTYESCFSSSIGLPAVIDCQRREAGPAVEFCRASSSLDALAIHKFAAIEEVGGPLADLGMHAVLLWEHYHRPLGLQMHIGFSFFLTQADCFDSFHWALLQSLSEDLSDKWAIQQHLAFGAGLWWTRSCLPCRPVCAIYMKLIFMGFCELSQTNTAVHKSRLRA